MPGPRTAPVASPHPSRTAVLAPLCLLVSLILVFGAQRSARGELPAPPAAPCTSRANVAEWPVADRIGRVLVVGIRIDEEDRIRTLLATYRVGGILVRGTPGPRAKAQLRSFAAASIGVPLLLAVDEEGGRVQHLRSAVGRIPSAQAMASTLTADQVRALARDHGTAMRSLGFTADFAPVLDIGGNPASGIGDRGYASDPDTVARYGLAFAQGLIDAGILPVVKHFPGHGRADADSHRQGPTAPPLDELRRVDLLPFGSVTRAADVAVMSGHLWVPGTRNLPASLNPEMIDGVLRGELGFQGLVVTDSLSMWAIRASLGAPRAAELALRAGNDVLVFDDEPGVAQVIDGLRTAIAADPALDDRLTTANLRFLRAKGVPLCAGALAVAPAPPPRATSASTTTTVRQSSTSTSIAPVPAG